MQKNEVFESYLETVVTEGFDSITKEAMRYSLMNGGKRLRPLLLFSILEDYGINSENGFPCGCAIEMIHTYSLIHDDLPAMDNDDLRRGKPTCHKAYNEAVAILAGDGLLTKAFEIVLSTPCTDAQKVELVKALATYSGIDGMILGQDKDMASQANSSLKFSDLEEIEIFKTAKLLTLPMVCACILADKQEDRDLWIEIGKSLGILFQVQDDILDFTSSSEVLGKSTSDHDNDKFTAISLLGLEQANDLVMSLKHKIETEIQQLSVSVPNFEKLFETIINRTY